MHLPVDCAARAGQGTIGPAQVPDGKTPSFRNPFTQAHFQTRRFSARGSSDRRWPLHKWLCPLPSVRGAQLQESLRFPALLLEAPFSLCSLHRPEQEFRPNAPPQSSPPPPRALKPGARRPTAPRPAHLSFLASASRSRSPGPGPGTMSFGSEHYVCASSSTARCRDGSRSSSRFSGAGGVESFRSQSLSCCNVASAACSSASSLGLGLAYRRSPASDGLDPSQAAARTNEYKIIRTNEKEQLQGLNDRRRVHREGAPAGDAEPSARGRAGRAAAAPRRLLRVGQPSARSCAICARSWRRRVRGAQALLERDGLAEEVQRLRARCEEGEPGAPKGPSAPWKAQQRDVDGATLARLDLEKKVESLLDELAFVRQVHDEGGGRAAGHAAGVPRRPRLEVDVSVAKPDLSSALREIRAQYGVAGTPRTCSRAEDVAKSGLPT